MMHYELLRTPFVFVALVAVVSVFMPFGSAVEFLAISFFAGIGSFELLLAHAQTAPPAGGVGRYSPWDHPKLLVGAVVAGAGLAMGGGALRRVLELGAAGIFSQFGTPFNRCYASPSIFWTSLDPNWFAVIYGIFFGTVCGGFTTHQLGRQGDPRTIRERTAKEFSVVDGFGTGFLRLSGFRLRSCSAMACR
jgi:hypothetical protein